MVDNRALNEIYLPRFKAVVREAHVMAIMTSANEVDNDFVGDSVIVPNDTSRRDWGFDGVVLIDWLQTRSTDKAAEVCLVISMPGGECPFT